MLATRNGTNVAAPSDDGSGSAEVFMELASRFHRRRDASSGPDCFNRLVPRYGVPKALPDGLIPSLTGIVFEVEAG